MATTAATPHARPNGVTAPGITFADDVPFTCPGEAHPISRSVHFARLAAFYPPCRTCQHRHDAGHLPLPIVEHLDRTNRRKTRETLVSNEGVRGIYLNELARPQADRYAAAFAGLLWERQPLQARISRRRVVAEPRRGGPTVVIGHDDRPTAPDLVVGAAAALRRMGCHVIDVGVVSTPCFWSAVDHLQASGGVYVTGQGCGPAGIGLDFVEAGGIPWSRGGNLDRLESAFRDAPRRTSRNGGSLRTFRARVPYEAGLLKHFHALRPLHVGVACLASTVVPLLTELLDCLPCRIDLIASPVADDASAAAALAMRRLAEHIRENGLCAGILIGDDGQTCRVVDERGIWVPAGKLAAPLAELVLSDAASRSVVIDAALGDEPAEALATSGFRIVPGSGSREAMARALTSVDGAFGCDAADRFWFGDAQPRCDALVTLARILQLLGRSSSPLSALRSPGSRRP